MLSNYRILLQQCLPTARFGTSKKAVRIFRTLSSATSGVPTKTFPETCMLNSKLQRHLFARQSLYRSLTFTEKRFLSALRPHVDNNVSYSYGRSGDYLKYSTIIHEFDRRLQECPDEIVYISYSENKEISLRQLDRDINRLVKGLVKNFGIIKGDFVGVFAYNCYNWLVIQLACARIGAVLCPINPSNKSGELAYVLTKAKVKCLFLPGPKSIQSEQNDHFQVFNEAFSKSDDFCLRNAVLMDQDNFYEIKKDGNCSYLKTTDQLKNCNIHNWDSIMDNDGIIFESLVDAEEQGVSESDACILSSDSVGPDDLFAVYYTSGTTGNPKGACISHFVALNNARFCQTAVRAGRPESWKAIISIVLPIFHIYAGVLINFAPLITNARVIYSGHKYVVKEVIDSIFKYNANTTALTPTMLIDMLSYIDANKLNDMPLKIIQSGGAYISPETVNRTYRTLPNLEELRVGYGSTENGSVATMQKTHEPSDTRPFSVGAPLDFTEVRIVKPNTDELVPLGEKGEIQTRGFNTMSGYLDDPEKTSEVLTTSRWYKTGDMGLMYPHGSIQICGRLKNMIIKGGENIYPEEVSNLIRKLDFVENAHVVGVPDKRFGEQVCAWVKLLPGYKEVKSVDSKSSNNDIHVDDIINYCKKNITYFKVPRYVLFVEDFPMTATKKVQSHLLTQMSIEILGLHDQLEA